MHHLKVREMMPTAMRAVRVACSFDGIEGLTNGAISERMEVHLEAESVQLGDVFLQPHRINKIQAGVVGRATAPVEVGLEHCGCVVLRDTVEHDLDRAWRKAPDTTISALLDEFRYLLTTAVAVPPQGSHDSGGEPTAEGQLAVGLKEVALLKDVTDGGVLPSGDPEAQEMFLGKAQSRQCLSNCRLGEETTHQAGRPLVQCPRRESIGFPLDSTVRWVRGLRSDACSAQGRCVGPRAVRVSVRQERRPVGYDTVEHSARRRTAGEVRHAPAGSHDPRQFRMRLRIRCDRRQHFCRRRTVRDAAAHEFNACHRRVDVGILKPWDQKSTV